VQLMSVDGGGGGGKGEEARNAALLLVGKQSIMFTPECNNASMTWHPLTQMSLSAYST
jgi:hypothetical protein